MKPIFSTRFTRAGALALLALLAGCGGGGDASPKSDEVPVTPSNLASKPGVLSLSASPRDGPLTQYASLAIEAFKMAFDAGARGQMSTATWHSLEPSQAGFNADEWRKLNDAIQSAQTYALTEYVGIQVINTNKREMPDDLAGLAFDDDKVKRRFHALLDKLILPNKGRIKYLSVGNEVDAYLRAHPSEWSNYRRFYEDAAAYAKSLDAQIQVGVTATGSGAFGESPAELRQLNAVSDVVILTYYPLQFDAQMVVTVRDPSVVQADFKRMLAFAGNKPLVMQEVGVPASPLNSSSEATQAAFVTQVFAAWKDAEGRIPFLNYFLLHDVPQKTCDDWGVYYELAGSPSFKAFLCSLGLRTASGQPKLAWAVFQNEAKSANLP